MKTNFVKELNADHLMVITILRKIMEVKILNHEVRQYLRDMKKLLVEHFAKEDEFLYPELRQLAETDFALRATMEQMDHEMKDITKAGLSFLDTYIVGGLPEKFNADFSAFRTVLVKRLTQEEHTLYAEITKKMG